MPPSQLRFDSSRVTPSLRSLQVAPLELPFKLSSLSSPPARFTEQHGLSTYNSVDYECSLPILLGTAQGGAAMLCFLKTSQACARPRSTWTWDSSHMARCTAGWPLWLHTYLCAYARPLNIPHTPRYVEIYSTLSYTLLPLPIPACWGPRLCLSHMLRNTL